MKPIAVLAALLIAVSGLTHEPGGEPLAASPTVVATVNGEPIYLDDLASGLGSLHEGAGSASRGAFDLDHLVFRVVNDLLIAQDARAIGLDEDAALHDQIEALRERLALAGFERVEIRDASRASEDEIRAAFEESYQTATFHTVTLSEETEAHEVLAELEAGADLAEIARERSIDQFAPRGGLMEKVDRLDVPPEVAEVLFALEPGELGGPVRTGLGWAILRAESLSPADETRLAALEGQVRRLIEFRKADARRAEVAAVAAEHHRVEIHWEVIEAIACERQADGRLLAEPADAGAVVATVGERSIIAADLGRALTQRWRQVRNEEAALAMRAIVVDRQVRDEMMRAEALRRGFGERPEVERALAALETQLLVPRYLEEVVGSGVEVADEEVRSYYERHPERFREMPRVHLGQITVADEALARSIADQLRAGADLAWLAREHSIDRFKDSGGDRGWMVPAEGVDSFQTRLIDASPGTVIGPSGDPGNYVVTLVDAREEQGLKPFAAVEGSIRSALYAYAFSRRLDETITTLRDHSEIVVHDDVLASLDISASPSDEGVAPAAPHGLPGDAGM